MGVTGMTRAVASTITISSYNVLAPSPSPTTGAAAALGAHQAGSDASSSSATTIGVAVGVVLSVLILAAVAVMYRRSHFSRAAPKDTIPTLRMVPASTFKSHDFDAETSAPPVVSPMAMATAGVGSRVSTFDVIPAARGSVAERERAPRRL